MQKNLKKKNKANLIFKLVLRFSKHAKKVKILTQYKQAKHHKAHNLKNLKHF